MSRLLIRGGNRLQGEVTIQGAKNSVLPILAATILTGGSVELRRCPRLRDVEASIRILQALGCKAGWRGDVLEVDTAGMSGCDVPDALMREMRSSVIFLGAILARCGQADLSYPGGCELGPRPIDLHLAGLRDLGAEIREEGGFLHCRADRLRGREVVLRMPSVGATENLMLAACGAEGVTVISNAAREPEVVDLQNFLNACGARVSGAGSSIEGGQDLHGCTYRVMPDRIAAATYLCAAASAGGDIYLRGAEEGHLSTVTAALREAGCGAQEIRRELEASGLDSIVYVGVETLEYLRRGGRVTAGAAAIGAVLQIKPLLKIEGELLDACAKVRGTAGCKKKLLETIRGDAERLSAKWDIDIAVAGSYQDAAALEDWREMAVNAFPEHGGIFADPLSFSVSSHVGPDAFGMAVSRRLARTKDGI